MATPQATKEAEEETYEGQDSDDSSSEEDSYSKRAAQVLTCRKVTLNMLMEDGLIQAGEGVLSIDYLGQKFEADLLPTGRIKWSGSRDEFGTPSAWALHCKKLVNPIKRSGCGWASVKYKNKKLDMWKSIWARKQRQTTTSKSPQISPAAKTAASEQANTASTKARLAADGTPTRKTGCDGSSNAPADALTSQSASAEFGGDKRSSDDKQLDESSPSKRSKLGIGHQQTTEGSVQVEEGIRQSVAYSSLGQRSLDVDPMTLIKCEHFDNLSRIQPFTVSATSNTLLLMDLHCHLSKSEVVGYLGGRWDCHRHHLSIEQAFPCKCRLGDKEKSSYVEQEIQRSMQRKGLMVVGWYHSHPTCQPDPSLRDLDCQMAYQLRMRGSGAIYLPCIGFIISPFEKRSSKQDSQIEAFWVMPNLEHPSSFNIPMHVTFSVARDLSLTEDLLADLKSICEYYTKASDRVPLKDKCGETVTYMEKIKTSLKSKLPEDQLDSSTFLDYVQQLLGHIN